VGLLLLDRESKGALTVNGNGSVVVKNGGSVIVDSNNSKAAILNGNAKVSAAVIDVTGGTSANGNAVFEGTLKHDAPISDPLNLPLPPAPSTTFSALNYSGKGPLTLNPGTYVGGITINGLGTVTLNPGVYYLKGGGLTIKQGQVIGNGVIIINAPASSKDSINLNGGASLNLTAPASLSGAYAPYAGIALFQDRDSTVAINLNGSENMTVQGVLYAPRAPVKINGSGNLVINSNSAGNIRGQAILYNLTANSGSLVIS
jgi:hypothetical protein